MLQVDTTGLRVVVAIAHLRAEPIGNVRLKKSGDLGRRRIGLGRAGSVIIFS